jgi:hypothetical protein
MKVHAANVREAGNQYILVHKSEGKRPLVRSWNKEIQKLYERSISRMLDSSSSKRGPVAGFCGHGNETLSYIKGGIFINQLSNYFVLNKISAPQSLGEFI